MAEVLRTRDLTKRYKGKTALDGLSIALEEGHIYGLIGPEGAGKTTLLRLLAGLSCPSAGSLRIFGGESEKGSVSWWGSPSPPNTFPSGGTWSFMPGCRAAGTLRKRRNCGRGWD